MTRSLSKLTLGVSLTILALAPDASAGRGGGRQRGGGGGMQRGGGGEGGRGEEDGGGMGHSPSFSRPQSQSGGSESRTGESGRSNAGAAAGAGYSRNNQPSHPDAAPAAAGAGYSNRNQPSHPNAAPAAAGAGYSNRNQPNHPDAAPAAAGAGYSNRNNQPSYPNAGAAAAGAGYANRNNSTLPNGGAGVVGAGYANRNNGASNRGGAGYWNGNNSSAWGTGGLGTGYGGVAAWGTGSPMYGWGYSSYNNPYSGGSSGPGGNPQAVAGVAPQAVDYTQPINTTPAPTEPTVADQATSTFAQARDAFQAGDYAQALQLDRQSLSRTPGDLTMHQFLALAFFANGQYDQAAAPLYAVLSAGPGWDWTTLSGMYPDVETYTGQLRNLEASVRANPDAARARFVLAYHYLCQGHDEAAIAQLKDVVRLQPGDTLSAQLVNQYRPAGNASTPPGTAPSDVPNGVNAQLVGKWSALPPTGLSIALAISDDGRFTWTVNGPGKPPMTMAGSSTMTDGVLTLSADGGQAGALVGRVTRQDVDHFTFRLVGGPSGDPGLTFGR